MIKQINEKKINHSFTSRTVVMYNFIEVQPCKNNIGAFININLNKVNNDIIKEIKEDYGLSPSVVRATASIIYKSNKEEIEEKNGQVEELLTFCR